MPLVLRGQFREQRILRPIVAAVVLCVVAAMPASGQIAFEDVTTQAGITYVGRTYGSAWGDFDSDGCIDIFVSNHYRAPSLYRNRCDGTFVDVAEQMIPDYHDKNFPGDFHGPAWADYNNDGKLDLLLSTGGNRGSRAKIPKNFNRLYENVGNGFVDRAEAMNLADPGARSRTPYWLDMTGDGRLDVLLNQKDPPTPASLVFRQDDGRFTACPEALRGAVGEDWSYQFATRVRLFASDTPVLIYGFGDTSRGMFTQADTCRFEPAAYGEFRLEDGIADFVVADFDRDLRSDVFLVQDKSDGQINAGETSLVAYSNVKDSRSMGLDLFTGGTLRIHWFPDVLWRKETVKIGKSSESFETFKRRGKGRIVELSPSDPRTNGVPDAGDSDPAISIGFLPGTGIWRITARSNKRRPLYLKIASTEPLSVQSFEPSPPRQQSAASVRLLVDRDRGLSDHTDAFALSSMTTACDSAAAGDFDNDMDLDLYLVCSTKLANLPNRVYANESGQRFVDVSEGSGAEGSLEGIGDHVSVGDYDNDGFLDLFVANGAGAASQDPGPHQLFRNRGNANNWLKIQLAGTTSNRDAYGSRVFVTAGGLTQVRELAGGMRFGVQDSQTLHFGLAGNESVDAIVVQWPTGETESFGADAINRLYRFTEGEGGKEATRGEIALLASRLPTTSGAEQAFVAVHGQDIDKASIRWRISESTEDVGWVQRFTSKILDLAGVGPGGCEGLAVCRHAFATSGIYRVTILARTVDGKDVSASQTVAIQ